MSHHHMLHTTNQPMQSMPPALHTACSEEQVLKLTIIGTCESSNDALCLHMSRCGLPIAIRAPRQRQLPHKAITNQHQCNKAWDIDHQYLQPALAAACPIEPSARSMQNHCSIGLEFMIPEPQ
eukprot:5220637-Amphidinium_carterae.1